MTCSHCQAPDRQLYGPGPQPALELVRRGNWIDLERCPQCGALWCLSPYEPYAAFVYLARWERPAEDWARAHDLDDGRTLLRWHATYIRAHWLALPAEDRDRVDAHRRRSYGHNPIDSPAIFGEADLEALLGPTPPPAPG